MIPFVEKNAEDFILLSWAFMWRSNTVMTRWEVSNNCILPWAEIKRSLCPMLESRITTQDPAQGKSWGLRGLTHLCHSPLISCIIPGLHWFYMLNIYMRFYQPHGIFWINGSARAGSYPVTIIPLILFGGDLFGFVRQQRRAWGSAAT